MFDFASAVIYALQKTKVFFNSSKDIKFLIFIRPANAHIQVPVELNFCFGYFQSVTMKLKLLHEFELTVAPATVL